MQIKKNYILITILLLIFLLILSPRIDNPYPTHIDEWHHITESIKLNYQLPSGITAAKAGFHYVLLILGSLTNLILIYKFLPAIWITLTAILLFFLIKYKTKNYSIALLTIIFFASIKSNANLTGLWFFTPLTFSIPFIYLYIYLFSKGIQEQNKKLIIYSLAIMIFLIPIHSISVLFAIPLLTIYLLSNTKYLKKEYKFFLIFLLIPIIGIIFYMQIMHLKFIPAIEDILSQLQFKHGWGILEKNNSPFELYSPIGYLLSLIGFFYLTKNKKNLKKYLIYILWPITVLISIFIFKQTGTSYLSPYQRNLYYFALSLPFLSAVGTISLMQLIKRKLKDKNIFKIISIILIIIIITFTFYSYYSIPNQIKLYKTIDKNNYEAISFLSTQPIKNKVISTPEISTAIYPISKHQPLATLYFYGNRNILDKFFETNDCNIKNQIIDENKISYILSENPIDCNWEIIYNKKNFIYKV